MVKKYNSLEKSDIVVLQIRMRCIIVVTSINTTTRHHFQNYHITGICLAVHPSHFPYPVCFATPNTFNIDYTCPLSIHDTLTFLLFVYFLLLFPFRVLFRKGSIVIHCRWWFFLNLTNSKIDLWNETFKLL